MTTNIERAIEIIEDERDPNFGPIDAPSLIYALNDAGLLTPDLPEPSCHNHRNEPIWETEGATKIMTPGMLPVSLMGPFAQGWDMHPIEARDIAYALLAAANHAEQEQGNDGENKYTVRYYNPIMGVYETHWDTQEEAEKEAAYDHGMNGAPTRVLDPDGNEIATFEEGQRHD